MYSDLSEIQKLISLTMTTKGLVKDKKTGEYHLEGIAKRFLEQKKRFPNDADFANYQLRQYLETASENMRSYFTEFLSK